MSATKESEESTRQQKIWQLTEQLRSSSNRLRDWNPVDLVIAAKEQGIQIDWKDLPFICSLYGRRVETVPPRCVADFLRAYFADQYIKRVLDPWAGTGMLLTALVQSKTVHQSFGIVRNHGELTVAHAISEGLGITWLSGNPLAILPDFTEQFDAVISSPPFNMDVVEETLVTPSGSIAIRDSKTHLLVLRSCLRLTEAGEGMFVLPNTFFLHKARSVLSALPKVGLHVHAVLALPEGAFAPWTSLDANLVIIGRQQFDQLFVAQIDPARDPAPLLENLRTRRVGRIPEFGRLIDPSKFRSWRHLLLDEEISVLATRSGTHPVPLADIAEAINLGNRSADGGFEGVSNVVYLPLIGTSPAVTSLTALQIKPQNAAQIVLRPESAFADYVAEFFNSTLGRKIREQLCSGIYIPKITKQTLTNAIVYLPPIETQTEVAGTQRSIRELTLSLAELERTLWNRPRDVLQIKKAVASLNQQEGFEAWLEMLPFPLASILWRYHTDAESHRKNAHLLHFFEATAQFVTTLMLSAFHSDIQFFQDNRQQWLNSTTTSPHSWKRSTFGDWVILGERLAKFTRRMLSDKEQRERCLALYKTRNPDHLDALISKELFATLKKVNTYRNDWKGHGGIESASELARRLAILEGEQTHIREVFADTFAGWTLIRPGKNKYTDGVFHYTVTSLMGTRTIFKQIAVQTVAPM